MDANEQQVMEFKSVICRVPKGGERVFKDECLFCFDTPRLSSGIFVCLDSFHGYCGDHLKIYIAKTKKHVFLNLRKIVAEDQGDDTAPPEKRPTKLAIGLEGGFDVDKQEPTYEDVNNIVVVGETGNVVETVSLQDPRIPLQMQLSVAAIVTHQGAAMQEQISAWDGEKRVVSKHADDLLQLDNGVKIPPSGWQCSMCDLTQNLWLNLTDGAILCGRRYFDGSGGNNHAIDHYEKNKFPLAVKLGTITSAGGDVFSYDEDDMVEDPYLAKHLSHFGINVASMEKTDKTMTELEIEVNLALKAEWDTIQESGKKLEPLYGPSYTGMTNLGNSCYMNSIMQVLFSMEEFQRRYADTAEASFQKCDSDPSADFNVQMCKLGAGLVSGKYSQRQSSCAGGHQEDGDQLGITPSSFKALIGKGHSEFNSNRQQDAQEFLLHFFTLMERQEKATRTSSVLRRLFTFKSEERLECSVSHKVRYHVKDDVTWVLPLPLEAATNRAEFEAFEARKKQADHAHEAIPSNEVVRLRVPMTACIEAFASRDCVHGFYSPAIDGKTDAFKSTRFASFPDYLVVQTRRFTVGDDWTPKKLDVAIDVLDTLDLNSLRGLGLQPNEEELVDVGQNQQEVRVDEAVVDQLCAMGFARDGCRRAVHETGNAGVDVAMNWVLEHSGDADFASPFPAPAAKASVGTNSPPFVASEEGLMMLEAMGFNRQQGTKALRETDNNLERAADWLFSHPEDASMEDNEPSAEGTAAAADAQITDGPGNYDLFAFVSHMGTSTSCGHYVCHVRKEGRWVIYNDRKVAASQCPPKDLAYLYFYRRTNLTAAEHIL